MTKLSGRTSLSYASWRLDGVSWRASGATANNLTPGNHTIEYDPQTGYATPPTETVSLVSGANSLTRTYAQLASITITLTPSTGQFQVDGGTWRNSGGTTPNLVPGTHTITYGGVTGYVTPANETITLVAGLNPLTRSYVQMANVAMTLAPSNAQWLVVGRPWHTGSGTEANLAPGTWVLSYATVTGYVNLPNETITLTAGQTLTLTRSFTPTAQAAQLTVNLTPSTGQWRIDGGAWRASGATATSLAIGNHTIEYNSLAGYTSPPTETISLAASQALTLTRSYH